MSGNSRLKVVVRRLPPNLPEPIFWSSVESWVTPSAITWKTYHTGKLRNRTDKPNVHSRAYIAFKDSEQVSRFSREYNGHAFRDKQGNESYAVVEYAPFQKIPVERKKGETRKKADARIGTITDDEDYKSFVASLEAGPDEVILPAPKIDPKTTPLLEALKADKAAAKDAAQILSYHGHYHRSGAPSALAVAKGAKLTGVHDRDDHTLFSRTLPSTADRDGPVVQPPPSRGEAKKGGRPEKGNPSAPLNAPKGPKDKGGDHYTKPSPTPAAAAARKGKPPRAPGPSSSKTSAAEAEPAPAVTILNSNPQASPRKPSKTADKGKKKESAPATVAADSGNNAAASTSNTGSNTSAPPASTDAPASEKPSDNKPGSVGPERERRRPVLNPRMFEAALAGVGGSRRRGDGKKPDGNVEGEATPTSSTIAAPKVTSQAPPRKPQNTHNKPPSNNANPSAGAPSNATSPKLTTATPQRAVSGSHRPPKKDRQPANTQPTPSDTNASAASAEDTVVATSPSSPSRGPSQRGGGKRGGGPGRGRGRGRGGPPGGEASISETNAAVSAGSATG